ncbi:Nif3-like dinuclear metal center hexameric protein [Lacticaseibacillus thailandensis]|uniref:GTP cyclohydrolase 1 type 2 homolog n=1 Tax=Lacticaseibacillus thailandensis DSM 22698 = JCM 13996 TaxID=1423810 RepID=A0A0R2CDR1_9LACO|nr:Nif3-like dinuclear metal center hexameric protein [Lacticaseibacillus thailandensis]KRM88132.1 nif3-related protein [Lacticaseibacillus thailandensis DSM 22698 = JCM 13996]
MTSAQTIIDRFEQFAPLNLALPDDPSGWQIGDPQVDVQGVFVTLDVRPATVAAAVAAGCNLIVAHHPAVFHAPHNLVFTDPQVAMYGDIIRHGITVYGAHTSLDNAHPGMNDWLATALGLTQVQPLRLAGELDGMGCIGQLPAPMKLADFVRQAKGALEFEHGRLIARDPQRTIQTVAVLGGSGSAAAVGTQAAGADILVTGDVTYHTGHDILARDFAVLDAGHHIEHIMAARVADLLRQWNDQARWHVTVHANTISTDPFTFV